MEFYEKTVDSRRIYAGKIINLRVDRVELPNGKISIREIVEHPGAVAVVPLTEEGHVIMVEQFRKALEMVTLEIPAGKLEPGEDPKECALRELEEETGMRGTKIIPVCTFFSSPGFSDEIMHLFVAQELIPACQNPDTDEIINPVTLPLAEAVNMIYAGKIVDGKTIVGLLAVAYRMADHKV